MHYFAARGPITGQLFHLHLIIKINNVCTEPKVIYSHKLSFTLVADRTARVWGAEKARDAIAVPVQHALRLLLFNLCPSSAELVPEENLLHPWEPQPAGCSGAARSILTLLQALVHSDGYLVHQVGFSPLVQVSLKSLNTQNGWTWKLGPPFKWGHVISPCRS